MHQTTLKVACAPPRSGEGAATTTRAHLTHDTAVGVQNLHSPSCLLSPLAPVLKRHRLVLTIPIDHTAIDSPFI